MALVVKTGKAGQSKKRKADGIHQGFGFIHSTPRAGKPFTWGRDGQKYAACKTSAGHVGPRKCWQTSLWGIAKKATENKEHRFGNLYQLLNVESLSEAFYDLKKKAAAGVDNITAKEYAEELETNLGKLEEQLKSKQYRAKLVRRVYIDKGNGKKRPLGIPAVSDKIVQRGAAKILEAIYETEFSAHSYGYRPHTGAQKAVKDLTHELNFGKYGYIVEADIRGFFDAIDHDWLIRMLELRIADKAFLRLIKKWLKAGVQDVDGLVKHPVTGCPQGGLCEALHNPPYAKKVIMQSKR